MNPFKSAVRPWAAVGLVVSMFASNASALDAKSYSYAPYVPPDTLTVVASFDGSLSLKRWDEILAWGEANQVPFTFFISSVYYVPDNSKTLYYAPPDFVKTGKSDIGFGGAAKDVEKRIAWTLKAAGKGHDIESHLNGHFNGVRWKEATWTREFQQFNGLCHFLPTPAAHIRFPHLAMNGEVYAAMADAGIKSIVSTISDNTKQFRVVNVTRLGGAARIVEFPIDYVMYEGEGIPFMDYNFFEVDQKLKKTPEKATEDMVKVYLAHAKKCFDQKRPFFINHHFSNMNSGAYWEAEKQVILELKKTYKTEFLTVAQLYDRVDEGLTSPVLVASAGAAAPAAKSPAVKEPATTAAPKAMPAVAATAATPVAAAPRPTEMAKATTAPAAEPAVVEQEEAPTVAGAEAAIQAMPPIDYTKVDYKGPLLNDRWKGGEALTFDGVIWDGIRAMAQLTRADRVVSGKIFYKRYGGNIKIKGTVDERGTFVLYEVLPSGISCGMLNGRFNDAGGVEGTWSKPDGSVPRAFDLKRVSDNTLYETTRQESWKKAREREKNIPVPPPPAPAK
jgi:hypothetical protein